MQAQVRQDGLRESPRIMGGASGAVPEYWAELQRRNALQDNLADLGTYRLATGLAASMNSAVKRYTHP